MTPTSVHYTGLEIDPGKLLRDRCIKGVIPPDWVRHKFKIDAQIAYPIGKLDRWLRENTEGNWAVYYSVLSNQRQMTVAFEHEFDAMTFVMADGPTHAFC